MHRRVYGAASHLLGDLWKKVWFNVAVVFLFCVGVPLFVAAFAGYTLNELQGLAEQGSEAHSAVCALRQDLAERVAGAERFLRAHPHGIPGIPASLIKDNLANQQRTLVALRSARCASKGGR